MNGNGDSVLVKRLYIRAILTVLFLVAMVTTLYLITTQLEQESPSAAKIGLLSSLSTGLTAGVTLLITSLTQADRHEGSGNGHTSQKSNDDPRSNDDPTTT
jgi:hypothetical protein